MPGRCGPWARKANEALLDQLEKSIQVHGLRDGIKLILISWFGGVNDSNMEKEMATHSSIFAREISWTEELESYSPWGSKRVGHNLVTKQQHYFDWVKIEN